MSPEGRKNKMNDELIKNLAHILVGIIIGVLITLSTVCAIYVGETYNNTFTEKNLFNCSIDNSILNVTLDNITSTVYVSIPHDYDLNNFTITCYIEGSEIPVVHHSSGRGSSSCSTVYNCTEWGICENNIQNRSCVKLKPYCYASKVEINKSCDSIILVGNDIDEYGCIGSAGYSWCSNKTKCIRIWEENCSINIINDTVKISWWQKFWQKFDEFFRRFFN